MTKLNLQVIDNFLPQKYFNNLKKISKQISWGPYMDYFDSNESTRHKWFYRNIEDDEELKNILIKNIRNKTIFKIKDFSLLHITLVPKGEAWPHTDTGDNFKHQMVLYVDGDVDINKGTGFYVPTETGVTLNTAVGFYANRAIFFESGVWHTPLVFASNNDTSRISIVAQF
jgi:hypothetical protein|tara:strand:+ start:1296 stop:1808 length:513 start_codon:yes stop_codon:yes gene_type:complete